MSPFICLAASAIAMFFLVRLWQMNESSNAAESSSVDEAGTKSTSTGLDGSTAVQNIEVGNRTENHHVIRGHFGNSATQQDKLKDFHYGPYDDADEAMAAMEKEYYAKHPELGPNADSPDEGGQI